ncbi:winged helix-turn-helix transcriptional regulator [Candidatus Woesearchaeota archaeon]|nr:winged helix-turn-helix transcriptional regulator [Candidatus Woesearchaeota archaeon]
MEIETLFTDSKWRILSELFQKSLSPTELAEKTGTSTANVSTQMRLLEALGYVREEKVADYKKGDARKRFMLDRQFAYVTFRSRCAIGKRMFTLDDELSPIFNVIMINNPDMSFIMLKILCQNEELLQDAVAYGYIGLKNDVIELLVIHEDHEHARQLNQASVSRRGKTYKIDAHLHTKEAFDRGIKNKDEYFLNALKKVVVISDRTGFLMDLKMG